MRGPPKEEPLSSRRSCCTRRRIGLHFPDHVVVWHGGATDFSTMETLRCHGSMDGAKNMKHWPKGASATALNGSKQDEVQGGWERAQGHEAEGFGERSPTAANNGLWKQSLFSVLQGQWWRSWGLTSVTSAEHATSSAWWSLSSRAGWGTETPQAMSTGGSPQCLPCLFPTARTPSAIFPTAPRASEAPPSRPRNLSPFPLAREHLTLPLWARGSERSVAKPFRSRELTQQYGFSHKRRLFVTTTAMLMPPTQPRMYSVKSLMNFEKEVDHDPISSPTLVD